MRAASAAALVEEADAPKTAIVRAVLAKLILIGFFEALLVVLDQILLEQAALSMEHVLDDVTVVEARV